MAVQIPQVLEDEDRLSFGLEHSFFTATKRFGTNHNDSKNLLTYLIRKLDGISPRGYRGYGRQFKLISDSESDPIEKRTVDYGYWNVKIDSNVVAGRPGWFGAHETQSIELISPPFPVESDRWELDLQRIFSSRVGFLDSPVPGERFVYFEVNRTTSLHIHIGNGISSKSAFPFETIRNLAMILLVYETDINKMLDPRTGSDNRENGGLSPTENTHFKSLNIPLKSPRSTLASHLFDTCKDIQSVIDAMSPPIIDAGGESDEPPFYRFDFRSLLDSPELPSDPTTQPPEIDGVRSTDRPRKRKQPTIEFRQACGSLQAEHLVFWIRFLAALMDLAGKLDVANLKVLLGLDSSLPTPQNQQQGFDAAEASASTIVLPNFLPVGSMARLVKTMELLEIPFRPQIGQCWISKGNLLTPPAPVIPRRNVRYFH
ncbi:hypothetical protein FQN57_006474 [Myotisia sp. PD_48]|nr:hypothetical protein FQN57_006474 [Myotisia sp. PD_48]